MEPNRIRIENVTTADSAVFQCEATNAHGQILENVILTVNGELIL